MSLFVPCVFISLSQLLLDGLAAGGVVAADMVVSSARG